MQVVVTVVVDIVVDDVDIAAAIVVVVVPLLTLVEDEWISEEVISVEGKVDQIP